MRISLSLALLAGLFLMSCGKKNQDTPTAPSLSSAQIQDLTDLRIADQRWALKCDGNIMCGSDGDGDSAFFAGLLCQSGDKEQCAAVRLSQCTDGRPCRAPDKRDLLKNSSSRDMLMGYLHVLVATKDLSMAHRLLNYIEDHNHSLCTDADDNRCSLDPVQHTALWGTMLRVWKYIGLAPNNDMLAGNASDEGIIRLEANFSESGYPENLVAAELYLRQRIGNWYNILQNAADTLVSREPQNPFFEYVAHGKSSRAADLTLQFCSKDPAGKTSQWSWQRTDAEQAWHDSMGWDCIFLVNILLEQDQ